MATHTVRHYPEERAVAHDFTIVFRLLAAVAAAVMIVFSLIALARIDWDSGMDSAAVEVADVTFTPIVAIATGVAGLVALLAAATHERTSKLVVGALLLCAGLATFIAQSDVTAQDDRVVLEDAHGWLLVGVGAALILAALALSWRGDRTVVDRADRTVVPAATDEDTVVQPSVEYPYRGH